MTSTKLHIAVVTPRYMLSGVALAQARFAAALADAGHRVDFIIGRTEPGLSVPDAKGVSVTVLGRPKARDMFWPIVRYLRKERPDVVFSAEDHLNTLVLSAAAISGSRAKISGSSRVTPFDTYSNKLFSKRWLLKQAARAVAWRADALTCVSRDMVGQYRQIFPNGKHDWVYNIVDEPIGRARAAEPLDDPWFTDRSVPMIVAAGSLAPWKGFSDLIHAIDILVRDHRKFRVAILGEGPLRGELEALVTELRLNDVVKLPGAVTNPLKYFARSDVFVLSSHVEGLPNVLVEAMMCGCTPVSTDCPTGPDEVLQGGRFGYLCRMKDPVDLARGIAYALDAPIRPDLLAEALRPFERGAVISRHFELLGLAT